MKAKKQLLLVVLLSLLAFFSFMLFQVTFQPETFRKNVGTVMMAGMQTKLVQRYAPWGFTVLSPADSLVLRKGDIIDGVLTLVGQETPKSLEVVSLRTQNDTTYVVGHLVGFDGSYIRASRYKGHWLRPGTLTFAGRPDLPIAITE